MDHRELATIKDTLGDVLHDQLDALVNQAPRVQAVAKIPKPDSDSKLFQNFMAKILLSAIIEHSADRLDKENIGSHGELLLEKTPALLGKLQEAWKIKKYRSIRLLEILQAPRFSYDYFDIRLPLEVSFRAPFFGAAVDGFLDYLETNEQLFRDQSDEAPYYAKICSMVQSSGAGKSRLLTELSKRNVVVLYISLRHPEDRTGFPLRDPIPGNILQSYHSANKYKSVCYAFMTVLFETLEKYLSDAIATQGAKNAVEYWSKTMCNMDLSNVGVRGEFFSILEAKYNLYAPPLIARASEPSSRSYVEEAAENFQLSLSESQKEHAGSASLSARQTALIEAYKKLGVCLEKITNGAPTRPRLVIAIDEAHPLTELQPSSKYRPADMLTRVINVYSHSKDQHAIWVVFASTFPSIADFSPPNQQYNSRRIATHGYQLFRPYTQLGWDQHAPALGKLNADDIAKISHILTYGRPLWKSLVASANSQGLLMVALRKLCGRKSVESDDVRAVLFGQRFALEVTLGHPDSLPLLKTEVANHLRTCLSITLDRSWCYTSYPSEPLLSCAAAILLHSSPSDLGSALMRLEDWIRKGIINIGGRGGLTSRLLWLLAKDLYIRKHLAHTSQGFIILETNDGLDRPPSELLDCKMVPVVGWLEFVFGKRVWGESDVDRQRARACFADAYVNFSHWISMDSYLSGAADDLPLELWTLRHWQRTSAVQCSPRQPLIDKVIPIYFKDANTPVMAPDRMSQIFISDEDRGSSSGSHLNDITRQHPSLGGDDDDDDDDDMMNEDGDGEHTRDGRPYIAIVADLGLSPAFSATFPPLDVADRDLCLRIYAAGVDSTTFPFLAKYPEVLYALQRIASLHKSPEDELPYGKLLDRQMRFGATASAEYMDWQQKKIVPTQPTE